jgi:ribose/xylose/arabinose/galactoside ABC-type transport system permease subunit
MNGVRDLRLKNIKPEWLINNVLLMALILMIIYFANRTSSFLDTGNFEVILQNNAILGIVAVAATFVIISGGVDLSIGSAVGMSGVITALAITSWDMSTGIAIVFGILTGTAIGAVNGVLCGFLGLNPVIVTLGMLGAVRGLTLLIHHDQVFGLNETMLHLGTGELLGVPIVSIIAILVFVAGGVFLRMTPWGRYLFAIGTNRDAAYLAALPVRALPFAMYLFCGFASGVAGVLLAARLNGASPGQQGLNLELQALTVVLLGGVAFSGGRGRLSGVLIGWIFLGVLENGLTLTNVTPFVETLVMGIALIFAASLDGIGAWLTPRLQDRNRVAEQVEAQGPQGPQGSQGARGQSADGTAATIETHTPAPSVD